MQKTNQNWTEATEKSLKVVYWVVKISLTFLWAKQQHLFELIF